MLQEQEAILVEIQVNLQNALADFIGEPNTIVTQSHIESILTQHLREMFNTFPYLSFVPRVEVLLDQNYADIRFYNPKTGRQMGLDEWIEGTYARS